MLNRDILIPHLLRFIFRIDQRLVQVLADVRLPRPRDLRALVQGRLQRIFKVFLLDPHLLDQSGDQGILLMHQRVQKMLLFDLLVSVIRSSLLEHIHSLDGLLRKFLYIHAVHLLFRTGCILHNSVLKPFIARFVSTVKRRVLISHNIQI